jgi:osmotically-inducible protein OsmY
MFHPTLNTPGSRQHPASNANDIRRVRDIRTPDVPPGAIRAGCAVRCRDGKAGRVARVLHHPEHGYPTHVIVRTGRLSIRHYRVPYNWVTTITDEEIELNLHKHDLQRHPEYLDDHEIMLAVDDAFHGAEAFHDHADYLAIKASAEDGVVTLRGNVRNGQRRLEAEGIVGRLCGVVGVHNLLVSDEEIAWNAEWALLQDRRVEITDLRVESHLGLLRLRGVVPSVSQRAIATVIARQVPGVHAVSNALLVAPHTPHVVHHPAFADHTVLTDTPLAEPLAAA